MRSISEAHSYEMTFKRLSGVISSLFWGAATALLGCCEI